MYSRTYGYIENDKEDQKEKVAAFTAGSTEPNIRAREPIPVETFHDSIGEAQFRRMYEEAPFRPTQYAVQEERSIPTPPCEEPPAQSCDTCPNKRPAQKGPLGFLDGFFGNINFDDIILVGLIALFVFDNDKENDYLTPIMLAILLFL